MKLFVILCLLALQLVQEGACTHLETCECHEIRELVSATVQQEISKMNLTDEAALSILESSLIATMERLVKPIQAQLDYHLPPLPTKYKR